MALAPSPDVPAADGAKPGAEVPVQRGSRYAYDADGRAKAREDAPITIGGEEFHRRRKNWIVTRELRALLRRQEIAGNRASRLRAQIEAHTTTISGIRDYETGGWRQEPVTDDDEIARLEELIAKLDERVNEETDDSDEAAYEIIRLLTRTSIATDGEDANDSTVARPPLDFLKKELDVEEAGDLAASLSSGGEPDPTPETTSS